MSVKNFYTAATMPIAMDVDPTVTSPPLDRKLRQSPPMFGAIALAAAVGVELMLTAFIAWGRLPRPKKNLLFSFRAWSAVRPERDLQIYVVGIALTLVLIAVSCWLWNRWAPRNETQRSPASTAATQVVLAIASLIAFLGVIASRYPLDAHERRPMLKTASILLLAAIPLISALIAAVVSRLQILIPSAKLLIWIGPLLMAVSIRVQLLLAPAAMELEMLMLLAVVGYWLHQRRRHDIAGWRSQSLLRSATCSAIALGTLAVYLTLLPTSEPTVTGSLVQDPLDFRTRIPIFALMLWALLDLHWGNRPKQVARRGKMTREFILPLVLVATLFVPHSQWKSLAGLFLQNDELHHWNYFALGPAIAFVHGHALITEIYSQYGVAWPYCFAVLRHVAKLTYANLIGISIALGCIYFVGLYLFLRLLLRDFVWAACGALLAVTLQIFSGTGGDGIIWNTPSSTMLRHPLDVIFFLTLLGHSRFNRRNWLIITGAICGVAVLFELDTGIDLILIFIFYCVLRRLSRLPELALDFISAGLPAAIVWLIGLSLASRGTVLHREFWSEYFEGLHNQAFSGFGLLPVANVSGFGLAIFAGMLIIYFFAIGLAASRIFTGRGSEIDLFLASMSAYGLGLLLLFVGRSHFLNLFHPMIPLAVVIVMLLFDFRISSARDVQWTSFPWILGFATLAMLWTKPEFAIYPSLLQPPLFGTSNQTETLAYSASDLAGIPETLKLDVTTMRSVAKEIQHLSAHDADIAVLDDRDTLLCYLSDRSPWSRYTSIFHCLITKKLMTQAEQDMAKQKTRYIVIRAVPPKKWVFADTWSLFHRFAVRHYHLERTIDGYEFWRRGR